jgi:hypothetical protein
MGRITIRYGAGWPRRARRASAHDITIASTENLMAGLKCNQPFFLCGMIDFR